MFAPHLPHDDWALAYFILEWLVRLGFIAVILPGRPPAAARIWLLFGFLLPIPAALVYALIGRTRNPPRRQERERLARFARQSWLARLPASSEPPAPSSLAAFIDGIGGNPVSRGNAVYLLTDYEATVDTLVEAIGQARYHVRLMAYILADDRVGRRIIDALQGALARGVRVKVMYDALGSRPWRRRVAHLLREAGIEARACNAYNPLTGGTGRLDRRNHRKIYVIDDTLAFIGSQNLVRRDFRKGVVNHEVMVRVEGPLAAELGAQFVVDWLADGGTEADWPRVPQAPGDSGGITAQLLPSGPDEPLPAYTLLLSRLLQEARQSVLIASPYTVLDEGLQLAVTTTALRGVDVTLLVSAVVDQPLVRLAQEAGYAPLLDAGVTIREYETGLLHAKYVLVDDTLAIIGTSNADIRSFQINSEISLVSQDPALVSAMATIARQHLAQSHAVTPAQWATRPLGRRMAQRVAALASPLL
ncbi:MAG: phospholipase D-like domain-containing protein [Pigmentiphaga sp.]